MILCFENANGVKHVISKPRNEEIALKNIQDFCKKRNFKIYYIRSWTDNNKKTFDVGSHTEFFHLYFNQE